MPAVARASATRIRYADDFRRACLERYRHGESPTALFREAGLDPKLVGYKRIERCFARWKRQELELSGGIDGGDAMTGDHAASTTSRGMTPPPASILVRQDPFAKDDFDADHGDGAPDTSVSAADIRIADEPDEEPGEPDAESGEADEPHEKPNEIDEPIAEPVDGPVRESADESADEQPADPRDEIIARQKRLIEELEREIRELTRERDRNHGKTGD
ncbi:hypothetical protein [Bifidobacterium callitrichos]|uniref:hypothetical protein n=1 Tax=Bifidobacterium callitrichos TaxID=762209 RepID=UPI0011B26F47|nr:hypothetical protein [Bifidobacterium callitrichos]